MSLWGRRDSHFVSQNAMVAESCANINETSDCNPVVVNKKLYLLSNNK